MKGGSRLEGGDDGITHFAGVHLLRARSAAEDVSSAEAAIDDLFDGGLDLYGFGFEAEGEAQKQSGGEDLCDGIGNAHAGDVWRGAAARLKEAEVEAVALWLAEAGAGQHAERTGDHGHFIAKDIAEEVFSDEHVEAARRFDELHGGVIDVEMGERHVGVFLGDFDHRLAPEHGIGEHVGFVHAGDVLAAKLGGFERDVGDADDLALFVNHGVDDLNVAIGECGAAFWLAEIHAAGKFADAEHVKTAFDEVGADRGRGGQGRVADARTEIGEEAKMLAQGQECTALGLLIGGEFFPLWPTDGAEKDGVAGLAGGDGFGREGLAHGVDGGTADELVVVFKRDAGAGGDGVEDAEGLGHDFGADAVPREDCEFVGAGHERGGLWTGNGRRQGRSRGREREVIERY